uniref:Uncharacterized protein n=1 Tax=Arcella intermedia TaxID=1963864 RepID=A0A6B2LK96_9EUKA
MVHPREDRRQPIHLLLRPLHRVHPLRLPGQGPLQGAHVLQRHRLHPPPPRRPPPGPHLPRGVPLEARPQRHHLRPAPPQLRRPLRHQVPGGLVHAGSAAGGGGAAGPRVRAPGALPRGGQPGGGQPLCGRQGAYCERDLAALPWGRGGGGRGCEGPPCGGGQGPCACAQDCEQAV